MQLAITNTGDGDFVIQDPAGIVTFSMTVAPDATETAEVSQDLFFRLKSYLDAATTITYTTADTEADSTQSGTRRVRAASTGALTLVNEQTVDGIDLVDGDRVLVKNQVAGAANGIYVVVDGGPWVRAVDMDTTSETVPNAQVFISEGDTLADTVWVLTTDAPIVLGTTALVFAQQLSEVAAAGSITLAQLADLAQDQFIVRTTASTGVPQTATVTAAARTVLDDTTTAAMRTTLGVAAPTPGTTTFVVGAPAGDVITVTATLKDLNGVALAAKAKATVWISDTAGAAPSAAAPDGGTAVSTGTLLKAHTAGVLLDVVSDATGVIAVALTESGTKNYYVNIAIGNNVASSAVLAFS